MEGADRQVQYITPRYIEQNAYSRSPASGFEGKATTMGNRRSTRGTYFTVGALPQFCAAMLLGGQAIAATGEISQVELIRIGNAAASFTKADDFSPQFDDSVALGRSFRVAMPFKRNEIPSMPDKNGGWTYNSDARQLTLTVASHGWTTMHRPDPVLHPSFTVLEGFELSNIIAHRGRQLEQNALGAQVDAKYAHMTSIGLAPVSADAISQSVRFDRDWNTLVSYLSVPPEDARRKMTHAAVVVEGRIVSLENGRASFCDDDGAAATFDSSTSVSEHFCVFNAVVTRVAIESEGELLAEWK